MKPILLYIKDKNALANWLSACANKCITLDNFEQIVDFPVENQLIFLQLTEEITAEKVISIAKNGYSVVALSNTPNNAEGIKLFQNGIRGYANTFAAKQRIEQIVSTVQADSVWLGPAIMQAIFQSLMKDQQPNEGWKERLTDREIQTAETVLESKSNREIAAKLGITERTVKAHLRNIFEKLEVTDRLSLVLKIKNWS